MQSYTGRFVENSQICHIPSRPTYRNQTSVLTAQPLEFPSSHLWLTMKSLLRDQRGSCMLFLWMSKSVNISNSTSSCSVFTPNARTLTRCIRNKPYHVHFSPLPQTKDCQHLLARCPNKSYHRLNSGYMEMSKGESLKEFKNGKKCKMGNKPHRDDGLLPCLYNYNINTPQPTLKQKST